MAKKLYREITNEDVHAVATMVAAGLRGHTILLRVGISAPGLRTIMERLDWPHIFQSKQTALAKLMVGPA